MANKEEVADDIPKDPVENKPITNKSIENVENELIKKKETGKEPTTGLFAINYNFCRKNYHAT